MTANGSSLGALIEENAAGVVAKAGTPASRSGGESPAIIWDGYGLGRPASGIYAHAMGLAQALAAQGVKPLILAPGAKCPGFEAWTQWTVGGETTAKPKVVWPWMTARALAKISRGRPLVYHGLSNFNVPYGGNALSPRGLRRVLTVHDLIPLLDDGGVGPALRLQMQWLMGRAVAAADAIVCVSEWTRRTVSEKWPKIAEKCVVIGNGVEARTVESHLSARAATPPTILSVARGERYKDLPMIAAIARRGPAAWRFRVVTDPRGATILTKEAPDLLASGRLVFLQSLSAAEMAAEFRAAHAYLQTSWYEGFCLPALDALRVAIPVVFRHGSGIDDVVGDEGGVGIRMTGYAGDRVGTEYGLAAVAPWIDALREALALGASVTFAERAARRLQKIPTWAEAATALLRLYSV